MSAFDKEDMGLWNKNTNQQTRCMQQSLISKFPVVHRKFAASEEHEVSLLDLILS
jgi:hypothetical protein